MSKCFSALHELHFLFSFGPAKFLGISGPPPLSLSAFHATNQNCLTHIGLPHFLPEFIIHISIAHWDTDGVG